ncbi:MAG: helix-turn-helix domain-containing protein [Clostridia bacterium]|nr:helix-turn-helix domain-containing protein [Clostridia bacterium]
MKKSASNTFVNRLADSLSRSEVIEITLKNTVVHALISSRIERSMNQKQFAEFMGVSQAMVSKWESGDCNFTVDTIAKICEKLGMIANLELISEEDYSSIMQKNSMKWEKGITIAASDDTDNFYIAA